MPHPKTSLIAIRSVVAEEFNVSEKIILSSCQIRGAVRPRQVGMYLARQLTSHSYLGIARWFGRSDHTTAMHAERLVHSLIERDDKICEQVTRLRAKLTTYE